MNKLSFFVLSILVLSTATGVSAQDGAPDQSPLDSCSAIYQLGSVKINMASDKNQVTPGETISFAGEIVNTNNIPLTQGTLIAKIFRRDDAAVNQGAGNALVDEIAVEQNIFLSENATQQANFKWKVPVNILGGEYYVAYYYIANKYYPLAGLIQQDSITGATNQFQIINSVKPKIATLFNGSTRLNGSIPSSNEPIVLSGDEEIKVTVQIQNFDDQSRTVPVQWNQYDGIIAQEENRKNSKTELVTLTPGAIKELQYTGVPTSEGQVLITVVTQDGDAKSISSVFATRVQKAPLKVEFAGLTRQGDQGSIFACVKSNKGTLSDVTILIKAISKDNQTLIQTETKADINEISGFLYRNIAEDMFPLEDGVTIEVTVLQAGKEILRQNIEYTCGQECAQVIGEENVSTGGLGGLTLKLLATGIAIIAAFSLIFWYYRRQKNQTINW